MMRDSVLNFAPEIVFFEKGNMWNSAVKEDLMPRLTELKNVLRKWLRL